MEAKIIYLTLAVVYVLGILAFAILMFEPREELILLYLPFTYSLTILNPEGKIWRRSPQKQYKILLILVCLLMAATAIYFRSQYNSLLYERLGDYSRADYFFSLGLIILAFFLTWADYGGSIPILALMALIYAYFGQYFPGFLYHKGISIERIIAISATEFNSGDGVLGTLPQIGITWIAIFTIFAGFASGFGILEYVLKISYNIFKKFKYGVPQVAVISSMIFGMFSGSGAANVAGTGSFTIPLMKRYRMPPAIAGSIESVASSGGQVMPPIMGAAAFVMASYLGKYYWQIVVVGFLPAFIFYATVALAV
ncbi:MAG: TRAP transporter large permease subunit, partial [bacterium]